METLVIPLKQGKSKYKLEERSPIEDNYPVAITTTIGDGTKLHDEYILAEPEVFNNAYVTFKEGQTDILERIPFEHIWYAVLNGKEKMLRSGRVYLSNSFVDVMNSGAIQPNTALILQVYYANPKHQKSKRI